MATPSSHSRFPSTALTYITFGGFLAVLSGTSYFFFDTSGHTLIAYLRAVSLIGGVGMIVLGFCVGFIGRTARAAELPPADAHPSRTAAPANPTASVASPPGMMAAAAVPPRHA